MTIEGKLMRNTSLDTFIFSGRRKSSSPCVNSNTGSIFALLHKTFPYSSLGNCRKGSIFRHNLDLRSRARMAKVKMPIYLTKPRPRHVWVGFQNEDDTIGMCQPVEYKKFHLIVSIEDIKAMI